MSRLCLLYVLAMGCSFRTNAQPDDGAIDARLHPNEGAVDAPRDAKVFLDAPIMGSLTASVLDFGSGDVNLTTEGTIDWTHWGYGGVTGFDHKTGGTAISDATATGATKGAIGNVTATATWSDGTPDAAVSTTGTGVGLTSPGALSITVPAGIAPHTLRVYCGNKVSTARLDVALSDGSAPAYSDMQMASTTALHLEYTIVYNAASDGQTLTVTWTDVADTVNGGFAMLLSATLQ